MKDDTIMHWAVEIRWSWGRQYRFNEIHRRNIFELKELDRMIVSLLTQIVDRNAFDCGRLDHPLTPAIHSATVTPVYSCEKYELGKKWQHVLDILVENEQTRLFEKAGGSV